MGQIPPEIAVLNFGCWPRWLKIVSIILLPATIAFMLFYFVVLFVCAVLSTIIFKIEQGQSRRSQNKQITERETPDSEARSTVGS